MSTRLGFSMAALAAPPQGADTRLCALVAILLQRRCDTLPSPPDRQAHGGVLLVRGGSLPLSLREVVVKEGWAGARVLAAPTLAEGRGEARSPVALASPGRRRDLSTRSSTTPRAGPGASGEVCVREA